MARYSFYCEECGLPAEIHADIQTGPQGDLSCRCGGQLIRDYRRDSATFTGVVAMKHEREAGGKSNQARLTLPTNSDFAGPGDPDGKTGMREWRETHEPRPTNKRPYWPGEVEKKVFSVGGN